MSVIISPEHGPRVQGSVVAPTPVLTNEMKAVRVSTNQSTAYLATLHPHDVEHGRGLLVAVTT